MHSPSDNPDLQYLWPTPILTKQFSDFNAVNPTLLELLRQIQTKAGAQGSPGYATHDRLLKEYPAHRGLQAVSQFIAAGVFEVASAVNAPYWEKMKVGDLDVHLTGLWFQLSNEFNFHETHVHGNCSWSGVYYVQSGDSGKESGYPAYKCPNGVTRFYGPHLEHHAGGYLDLGNFFLQDITYDSTPEDGKLVVFPSYLKHMIYPYKGSLDRVVISFHAQVTGKEPLQLDYSFNY